MFLIKSLSKRYVEQKFLNYVSNHWSFNLYIHLHILNLDDRVGIYILNLCDKHDLHDFVSKLHFKVYLNYLVNWIKEGHFSYFIYPLTCLMECFWANKSLLREQELCHVNIMMKHEWVELCLIILLMIIRNCGS